MNSLERVLALFQGRPVDRLPVAPLLSLYGASLTNCHLKTYYTDSSAYIAGQRAVHETIDPDILFGPFCYAKEGLPFGAEVIYTSNYPPTLSKPSFASCLKIGSFSVETLLEHPTVEYQEKSVAGLIDLLGDQKVIAPIMISPIDLPAVVTGPESWLNDLLFEPDNTQLAFEVTIPYFVERCNRLYAMGAPIVVLGGLFANPTMLPPKLIKTLIMPVLEAAFSQLKGPVIFHSGGAPILPFLEHFSVLPNTAGFVLHAGENPVSARQKVLEHQILCGNINGPQIHVTQPEELERQCTDLLKITKDDPRFLLGTSCGDIRLETPIERVQIILNTVKAYTQVVSPPEKILGIACGIFSEELKYLQEQRKITFPIIFLDSMLHMVPHKLKEALVAEIEKQRKKYDKILLFFGECHPYILGGDENKTIRLRGSNCIEIILGKERYKGIREKRSFVFLGEWIKRWEQVFTIELGLTRETAQMFMPEYHSEVLYLDTGCQPVPTMLLEECAEFCGLAWRVEKVDLENFVETIQGTIHNSREPA